jgi:hypothetical protein
MQIENSHAPAAFEPIAVPARQARAAIGVGPTKFYELIDHGELVSYLDGSRRMVTTDSLRSYVARKIASSVDKREVKSKRRPAEVAA